MRRRGREDLKKTFMGSAGWLFADLLLALAMLFLVANTIPLPALSIAHAQAKSKAKPMTIPHLEQTYHRFSITVDPIRVMNNNDVGERNAIVRQVLAQKFLHNRSAGLVIVYDGAPTINDIANATAIATTIYNILSVLGKQNATFARTSKYDPLYLLGGDPTIVKLDIFLFAQ
jgi:hypothetical protein